MSPMTIAVLLILIGLVLLVLEVFIPSSGLLFVLSTACLVVGVTMVFFAPESEGGGLYGGLITIGILVIIIPLVVALWFHVWPRTPIGKKFFLPLGWSLSYRSMRTISASTASSLASQLVEAELEGRDTDEIKGRKPKAKVAEQ